jgi:predicted dehydrogenase
VVTNLDDVTTPVDLAVICTPPTSHEPLIETALRRDAHVFCEKPVFLDPTHGERLIALAAARARIIYPGHNYVFSPMLTQLRTYAHNGTIGALKHVAIQIERTGPASGTEDWHPQWRTDITHSGGGILTDHGPHCVYLAEWLSGQQIRSASSVTDAGADGIDYRAKLSLTLTTGVTASASMSWQSDERRSVYRLLGTNGEARLVNNRLYAPDTPPINGVHESTGTTHAHHDWMAPLARDVISSLTTPERLRSLTGPAITVTRVLRGSLRRSGPMPHPFER